MQRRVLSLLGILLLAAALPVASSAGPKPKDDPGFLTASPPFLTTLAPGSSVKPLITVGEIVDGLRFESIPDGIAVQEGHPKSVLAYVNHETSLVPFPATRSDFTNAMVRRLTLNGQTASVLGMDEVIPSAANFQRFCSNFLAGKEHGFKRPILFTSEEARDLVYRTGQAWPLDEPADPRVPEQAGVIVAVDVKKGTYRPIYGMGRHNHENAVAIPGYKHPVILSGDDTFDAPASQLYLYSARKGKDVWRDRGTLYAFVSDVPAVNDYGDLGLGGSVSGRFVPVPRDIATGKRPDGTDVTSADYGYAPPPAGIPDGPQWVLETWSNANNVFQFIRIEDIAYDRTHENVVYLADTGEPRALPDPATGRLRRGPSGTTGPYPNGRIWKLVLDRHDPLEVTSLSVLVNADLGGYANPSVLHQPDNVETTKRSLLVQEDPGSHNYGTPAKIWRLDLATGAFVPVAAVDQSVHPGNPIGSWESSGIVDASEFYGPGSFLVDVQAHGWEIETAPSPVPGLTYMREAGQLLLLRIPGA
jgi:hypothetical protein